MPSMQKELHEIALMPTGTTIMQREGFPTAKKWVYQRVNKKFGNVERSSAQGLQLRRHVIPADPKTAAQINQRAQMRSAILKWRTLTAAEKKHWGEIGEGDALPAYQTFLRAYMRAAPAMRKATAPAQTLQAALANSSTTALASGAVPAQALQPTLENSSTAALASGAVAAQQLQATLENSSTAALASGAVAGQALQATLEDSSTAALANGAVTAQTLQAMLENSNTAALASGAVTAQTLDADTESATAISFNFGTMFYINGAAAVGAALGWGAGVYKLMPTASAVEDATTKTNQAALTGKPLYTVRPYATSTSATSQDSYGFAVDPAQMLSNIVGRRRIAAGTHTLIMRCNDGGDVLNETYGGTFRAYRVAAAAGRARTLLGSAAFSITLTNGVGTINAPLTLAQIDFGIDETIQYGLTWDGVALDLVALVSTLITGRSNDAAAVQARITFPGLTTFYP